MAARAVPWNRKVSCDSLLIIPQRRKYDSGFRYISLVALGEEKPRLMHAGDVLCMGWWSIDCLPKSGLLRVFSPMHAIECDERLSATYIFSR